MKLQIIINNQIHNELHLDAHDFYRKKKLSWEDNVKARLEKVETYVKFIKATYYKAIAHADTWQIYLVVKKGNIKEHMETFLEKVLRENKAEYEN